MIAFFSLFPSLRLTMSQNRSRQISSTSLFHPDHLSTSSPSLCVRDVQIASLNNPITETVVHFSTHLIKTVFKNWMGGYKAVRVTNGHCNYLTLQLNDWELNMMQMIFLNILFHSRWFEETRPHMIHETDSQSNVTNAVCCGRHKSP
jgi:hypothetical protein